MKQKWEKTGGSDLVMAKGNFVFRLHSMSIGVGSMGRAYSLRVRKLDDVKEEILGYAFWFIRDGGYQTHVSDSVDRKLWNLCEGSTQPDVAKIQSETEKILKSLKFI